MRLYKKHKNHFSILLKNIWNERFLNPEFSFIFELQLLIDHAHEGLEIKNISESIKICVLGATVATAVVDYSRIKRSINDSANAEDKKYLVKNFRNFCLL